MPICGLWLSTWLHSSHTAISTDIPQCLTEYRQEIEQKKDSYNALHTWVAQIIYTVFDTDHIAVWYVDDWLCHFSSCLSPKCRIVTDSWTPLNYSVISWTLPKFLGYSQVISKSSPSHSWAFSEILELWTCTTFICSLLCMYSWNWHTSEISEIWICLL